MSNKLEYIDINEIKPYPNNPRKNDDAVSYVANSISAFGFQSPIITDKFGVVIAGHTRLKAAKRLGLKKVPVIKAVDLSDEEAKALRLADNKVSEQAEWDFELLDSEIAEIIDLDMENFGFEFLGETEEDDDEFGAERQRTNDAYNLDAIDIERTAGFYQMPIIEKTDHIPSDIMGFNYVLSSKNADHSKGVHFYIDDYQFERIWNDPYTYIDKLAQFDCVFTPDFSLYMDMPMSMKIWNVYRSRLIGQMCQDEGITVIPTVSWAEKDTFAFCFDGIEPGSVVTVSTIGVKQSEHAMKIWQDGCREMIKRIKPKAIILYGGMVEFDFKGIKVIEFSNSVTDRMRESRKEGK